MFGTKAVNYECKKNIDAFTEFSGSFARSQSKEKFLEENKNAFLMQETKYL